jgi:hypothetical protein
MRPPTCLHPVSLELNSYIPSSSESPSGGFGANDGDGFLRGAISLLCRSHAQQTTLDTRRRCLARHTLGQRHSSGLASQRDSRCRSSEFAEHPCVCEAGKLGRNRTGDAGALFRRRIGQNHRPHCRGSECEAVGSRQRPSPIGSLRRLVPSFRARVE